MALLGLIVASLVTLALPSPFGWLALLLIWPMVSIHICRLHDMGRGGSWVAVPFALNIITAIAAPLLGLLAVIAAAQRGAVSNLPQNSMIVLILLMLVTVVVDVVFVLWVGLSRGEAEANAFGAPAAEAIPMTPPEGPPQAG